MSQDEYDNRYNSLSKQANNKLEAGLGEVVVEGWFSRAIDKLDKEFLS